MKKNDELPTKVKDKVWLTAFRREDKPVHEAEKISEDKLLFEGGKWIIYLSEKYIDEFWEKIKKATQDGMLGYCAKSSTAERAKSFKGIYLICVYTKYCNNEKDINRVREELNKLGIKRKIPYKRDIDTSMGKYSDDSDEKISTYFK